MVRLSSAKAATVVQVNPGPQIKQEMKTEIPELVTSTSEATGMVREIRTFKWGGFFLLDHMNGIHNNTIVQCVVKDPEILCRIKSESYIRVTGEIVKATVKKELVQSDSEFLVKELEVLSEPSGNPIFNIYEREIKAEQATILNNRALSLRNEFNKCVFKIQSQIQECFRHQMHLKNYVCISTPKLVANGAEGGTNVFSLDYFGQTAYLAQSPQLYKQMMCGVFGKVYETAPVFRAEPHNSSRHLNEYLSMDMEMIATELEMLLKMHKQFMWSMLEYVFHQMQNELAYIGVTEDISVRNPVTLTVAEAKDILMTNGHDMSSEEEWRIGVWAKATHGTDLVYLTHYHKSVRPFYTKVSSDGEHTESFDAIFKGIEITSGGLREESHPKLIDKMNELGMNLEPFADYLDAFKNGMPPHGGFAIGLERLTAKICGIDNVKMATLFPRDVNRLTP